MNMEKKMKWYKRYKHKVSPTLQPTVLLLRSNHCNKLMVCSPEDIY